MAKVLDNGDVASQAPVHTAALVTDQHTSADRCPARVWGREEGGQLLPQERYYFPSTHSGLAYAQCFRYFTQSPQEPRSWPFPIRPVPLGVHGPQGSSVGTVSCPTATSFTASPQESRLFPSYSRGRQEPPMGYHPDAAQT